MAQCLLDHIKEKAEDFMKTLDEPTVKSMNRGGGAEGLYCDMKFPIYSKGNGICCVTKEGLKPNEFVVEYFGELYPSWRWYEKCDRTKAIEKRLQPKNKVPDFYNITLEGHQDDPQGYDCLFVDPIRQGQFGSRLSHSCEPNCFSVVMAVNGYFTIGMYVSKSISYGEELTFDYNSITDFQNEYYNSVCYCSSNFCKGSYLQYSKSDIYQQIVNKHHTVIGRMALLYNSVKDQINKHDISILKKASIRTAMLGASPDWLKKYCAQLVEFIELEKKLLPLELIRNNDLQSKKLFMQHEQVALDTAHNVYLNRLLYLSITMDK
eukprot:UN29575